MTIEGLSPADLARDEAWRTLDTKLRPFVARRVTASADVDDVMQDIYLRILRGLHQLRDDTRFGPWVYRVARTAIIDHQRGASRRPVPTDQAPEVAVDPDPIDAPIEEAVAAYVGRLVTALPPPYREAIALTELEGRTQREAAQVLGVSVSGMKSRVQRGRHRLRTALEECCRIALDARRHVIDCMPRRPRPSPPNCCRRTPGGPRDN